MNCHIRIATAALAITFAAGSSALMSSSSVGAVGASVGFDYYISAPLVQGSHVAGAVKENFNAAANCNGPLGGGSITVGGVSCSINNVDDYGGATTDSATPTVGGAGSKFPRSDDAGTEFVLPSPQCYLGFYWSAGSGGNTVTFKSGGTVLLTLESDNIMSILDPSVEPTLEAVDGTVYNKDYWFGNPRGHTDSQPDGLPDGSSTINDGEPYVYLNLYGKGGMTFDSVVFSGPNFEFDNLAFSSSCQTPPDTNVFIGYVGEGESPSTGYPIDSEYLLRRTEEIEELPNTGSAMNLLVWVATGVTAGGVAILGARRRIVTR